MTNTLATTLKTSDNINVTEHCNIRNASFFDELRESHESMGRSLSNLKRVCILLTTSSRLSERDAFLSARLACMLCSKLVSHTFPKRVAKNSMPKRLYCLKKFDLLENKV